MSSRSRLPRRGVALAAVLLVQSGPTCAGIPSSAPACEDPPGAPAAPAVSGEMLPASADEVTFTLPGGVPLVMVRIAAGAFPMGSPEDERGRQADEGPVHPVTVARDYFLGRFEVTQAQWRAVMGAIPGMGHGAGDDYPVYFVSWNDITKAGGFLEQAHALLRSPGLRLPTEAEWEYAARAGTTAPFSFGDDPGCTMSECGDCSLFNQYMVCSGSLTGYGAWPVGSRAANPWGLYDMHGNVWEWVQDCYHASYAGAPADGSAWEEPTCVDRVLRSGHWHGPAYACRSANRSHEAADFLRVVNGFRLAVSAPPAHLIRHRLFSGTPDSARRPRR
jgi:formylglycine-generating enzyme required for sulfatase activity